MMRSSLAAALLFLPAAVHAAPVMRVPPELWEALLQKTEEKGVFKPGSPDDMMPASFALIDIQGDKEGDRQADYFSAFGQVSGEEFTPSFVSIVSETWKKQPDGGMRVDQWIINVRMSGEVKDARRYVMRRSPAGSILEHEQAEASDEEKAGKLRALVRKFSEHAGPKT